VQTCALPILAWSIASSVVIGLFNIEKIAVNASVNSLLLLSTLPDIKIIGLSYFFANVLTNIGAFPYRVCWSLLPSPVIIQSEEAILVYKYNIIVILVHELLIQNLSRHLIILCLYTDDCFRYIYLLL